MANSLRCHCGKKLVLDKEMEKKGRKNVYKCPKCGCVYSLSIVRMSDKCAEEKRGSLVAKIQKYSKKKRRRGRPRKNV